MRLLAGRESPPFFAEIARRLGERVGAPVSVAPGGHAAYHDAPGAFAEAVRPLLREISAIGDLAPSRGTARNPAAPA